MAKNTLLGLGDIAALQCVQKLPLVFNIVSDPKIGDTLACLPFMLHVARSFDQVVYVTGSYSPLVIPLCRQMPIRFNAPESGSQIHFSISVRQAFDHANIAGNLHYAQSHFALFGLTPPALPITLPLYGEWHGAPGGAVVCPFTASDENHSKLWWPDRWAEVISYLLARKDIERVYVVGGHSDDLTPYLQEGVIPLVGLPLTEIYGLMQVADIFLSVDAGLSHVAHLGSITKHVLLYPAHISSYLAKNPRAFTLIARPVDVFPDDMIRLIDEALAC